MERSAAVSSVLNDPGPKVAVVRGAPLIKISDPVTMPVPLTVNSSGAAPAISETGETEVMIGMGFLTVMGSESVVPPPGGGFSTAICNTAALERSEVRSATWSEVLLLKLVLRAAPLTVATEVATKLWPVTIRLNPFTPAKTEEGESELICGTGLVVALIVNVSGGLLVPPPGCGVKTVMEAVPGTATKRLGITTCNLPSLRKIGVMLIGVRLVAVPLHCTAEVGVKFLPFTVSVN